MADKKLFTVQVSVETEMVVLADDASEAASIGVDNYIDNICDCSVEPTIRVTKVKARADVEFAGDLDLAIPYVTNSDWEEKSILEYLAAENIQ